MQHLFKITLCTTGLVVSLVGPALAQTPTLTATNPARHAASASRVSSLQFTFSQAVTGAGGLRVHGNRWRGYRASTASGNGTATLAIQPTQVFAPGEEVSATIPNTVQGAGSGGQALASGQVVLFRAAAGPATGSFTAGPVLNVGDSYLKDMQLVDVNNDGRLDLLRQNNLNNTVQLRLGDGQGSFGTTTVVSSDVGENLLVLADFTNDGNLDLATIGAGAVQPLRNIQLQTGNGAGGFSALTYAMTNNTQQPLYLQAADVNADGNQDLIYIHYTPAFNGAIATAELRVGLGNGQGSFTSQPVLTLPTGYGGLRVTDADNDGRLDCLIFTSATGKLGFYQGNGQGGFTLTGTPTQISTAIPSATSLALGNAFLETTADFTGDGKVDVLLRDPNTGTLGLYAGTGQGTFGTPATFAATNIQRVGIADLEGDGDLDVVVVAQDRTSSVSVGTTTTWLNNGSGTFTAGTTYSQNAQALATGDVNNDGTTDLLVYDDALVGPFAQPSLYPRLGQPLPTAPAITSAPVVAAPGSTVTVQGINLSTTTQVLLGGVPITFAVTNAGTITFTMPAGSAAGGLITIITPTGMATSARISSTLAVRSVATTLTVELYPVPAHDAVQLRLPTATSVQVSLYNPLGQLARTAILAAPAGQPLSLSLAGLAPGLYTLRLTADVQVAVRKLLVE